jgi:hypothetical protein
LGADVEQPRTWTQIAASYQVLNVLQRNHHEQPPLVVLPLHIVCVHAVSVRGGTFGEASDPNGEPSNQVRYHETNIVSI